MRQLAINIHNRTEDPSRAYGVAQLTDDVILKRAEEILAARCVRDGDVLTSPEAVRAFLRLRLAELDHEVFGLVLLDNRHHVLDVQELFRGTIDGCSVYPREVVKAVLQKNAAAVLLFHNHPSTDPTPSSADRLLTGRLKDALGPLDIRVLDHLIVGGTQILSFAEQGFL